MQNKLPARKHPRLKEYDYSSNGVYFITLCVKDKRELLGTIVGRDHPGAPYVQLSGYGLIANRNIELIESYYDGVAIDNYVIMTNHVHIIISINRNDVGASRSPRPTNAVIPNIISAFKKFTSKEIGLNIWQTSYHDHIIRNEADYRRIWQYIEENPVRWREDCYYVND